eukprot:m.13136 g.13136  ORF g.13136 m.13136 type:complete len:269 (+) comp5903_c0_seq1:242-1048(+)
MAQSGATWPDPTVTKAIVLDFDKTITLRHTRGAIFQPSQMSDEKIMENFADLEFLRQIVPVIHGNAKLCIATFADSDDDALISGKELVRKYLELAFPGKSQEYFPDELIEAWNPANQDMNERKTGKNLHLENLRKVLGCKKHEMVLFDDSDRNCILAHKAKYGAVVIEAPVAADPESDDPAKQVNRGGFNMEAWEQYVTTEINAPNTHHIILHKEGRTECVLVVCVAWNTLLIQSRCMQAVLYVHSVDSTRVCVFVCLKVFETGAKEG